MQLKCDNVVGPKKVEKMVLFEIVKKFLNCRNSLTQLIVALDIIR